MNAVYADGPNKNNFKHCLFKTNFGDMLSLELLSAGTGLPNNLINVYLIAVTLDIC